jgi:2-keto-3-deoxy-L-rhamnonate aldolase RhmA
VRDGGDGGVTPGVPSLRERIDAGQLVLCLALAQARTADVPMIAAASGFDAVYIDLEHSAMSLETASLLCSASIGAGITPLVRVPAHDHQYLSRSLDIGAMGVIVPHVESRREAEQIVDSCRFPPRGHRSIAGPNPANRYQSLPQRDLLDAFDAQTTVAVMVETPAAVARADEIASVPGVDMVLLGPHDLTAEMGILGEFGDAAFLDAVRTVAKACRGHETIFGIAGIRDLELLAEFVRLGLRFVSAGTDIGFMTEAASAHAARLRAISLGTTEIGTGEDGAPA